MRVHPTHHVGAAPPSMTNGIVTEPKPPQANADKARVNSAAVHDSSRHSGLKGADLL